MTMADARTRAGFRFEDGQTGEEGSLHIVTAFRGSKRFVTLWPADGVVSKAIARADFLATPEGVSPGMKANEVFDRLAGAPNVLVACEDSEGTSIKIGAYPYELIFSACGLDAVKSENAELVGIGVP